MLRAVILSRKHGFDLPALLRKPALDAYVSTLAVRKDLAHPIPHAATRPVEQAFGTRRDRTDPSRGVEYALAAHLTTLLEHTVSDHVAQKHGFESGEHRLADRIGHGLHTRATRQHQHRIGLIYAAKVLSRLEPGAPLVADDLAHRPAGDLAALLLQSRLGL